MKRDLEMMFRYLEMDRVPTRLLLDYAVELVDIRPYSGESIVDSNLVNISTYENILRTIRSSAVDLIPPFQVTNIRNRLSQAATVSSIPVSLIAYQYNYIREDALTNGLIGFNIAPKKVYDKYISIPGGNVEWVNPYATDTLFAFSPLCNIYTSADITFRFPENASIRNVTVSSIEFNADDGNGYQSVAFDGSLSVNYAEGGYKDLKMRVALSDSSVLVAHSPLYILLENTFPSNPNNSSINPVVFNDTIRVEKQVNGKTITAVATIKYGTSNTLNAIHRPFIVAEGFDPAVFNPFSPFISSSNSFYHNKGLLNIDTFYGKLSSSVKQIYDLIYIDWLNSEADIRDNADLLIDIIEEINRRKDAESYSSVLMGQSMGGLISRYALCKMEQEGRLHDVTTYISHDAPHLGANVPLSILYLIEDLGTYMNISFIKDAVCNALAPLFDQTSQELKALYDGAHEVYFSPSVSQMLINNVYGRGIAHSQFLSELNVMGFPAGDPGLSIKNICLTNGAAVPLAYGTTLAEASAVVTPGWLLSLVGSIITSFNSFWIALFSDTELTRYRLLRCLLGEGKYSLFYSLYPLDGSRSDRLVYHHYTQYTKKFLWLITLAPETISENKRYAKTSDVLADGASGSLYTLPLSGVANDSLFVQDNGSEYVFSFAGGDSEALPSYSISGSFLKQILFIPTASSICYNNGIVSNYDYTRYFSSSNVNSSNTPFDDVVFARDISSDVTEHISLNPVIVNNVMSRVLVLDSNRFYHEYEGSVSGQSFPVTGDQYSVVGEEPYTAVAWAVSDSTLASIDSTGTITISGVGSLSVIANVTYRNQLTVLTKEIMVGFPPMSLDVVRNIYSITQGIYSGVADTSANVSLLNDSTVVYHWGVYNPNHSSAGIVWTSSSQSYILVDVNRSDFIVYLYLTNGNYTSQTYSLELTYYLPELPPLDPPIPLVNGNGVIFVEGDDGEGEEIVVKSESGGPLVEYIVNNRIQVQFDGIPSPASLIRRLLKEAEFETLLKTMKPWGEEEYLVLPVQITIANGDIVYDTTLKFLYKEGFPGE